MKRKKTILLVSVLFVIFAVCLVTVVIRTTLNETAVAETDLSTNDTEQESVSDNNARQDENDDSIEADADDASASSGLEAAQKLIGETLTREEIENAVGKCNKFDMSNAGCERGVYAGRFYYDDFSIFSRTYNKGKTFNVVSVNE